MPIDEHTANAVRERLANGESNRSIAAAVGVSRETVNRIANGTWCPRTTYNPADHVLTFTWEPGYKRCGTCGRLVRLPCLACLLEQRP